MIQVSRNADGYALKAAISNLLNALDREDISDDDRNKLVQTSVSLYAATQFWAENVMPVKFDAYDTQGERIPEDDPQRGAIYKPLRRRMWNILERFEWTRTFWPATLLVKQRGPGGRTEALKWLNPNLWEPDITTWEGLRGFRIRKRGTKYRNDDLGYVRRQDAIYINGIDFEDDYGGIAPAEVAYLIAGVEVEIAQTWLAIFRNRMMPFGVVQPAQGQTWPEGAMEIIKTSLRIITQGSRNAGKTIVSPGRAEWIQLGQKLDGVPVKEFDDKVDHAIELATGVYRSLVSPDESSYAQAEVGRRTWGHSKFVPHLEKVGYILTEDLAVEFPNVAEIRPRIDDIKFLKEDEASKANYVTSRVNAITLDLYTAQKELNDDDPNESLKDYYVVQGIPVHVSKFPMLADKLLGATALPEPTLPAGGGVPGNPQLPSGGQLEDQPQVMPPNMPTPERSAKRHIPEAQYQELKNWHRVTERQARKGQARSFKPETLQGTEAADFVSQALEDQYPLADVFAVAKSILEDPMLTIPNAWDELEAMQSQSSYRRGWRAVARGLWSGQLTRAEAENNVASTIRREFTNQWKEGAEAVGGSLDDFTGAEMDRLQVEISQEIVYALRFLDDIEAQSKAAGAKLAVHFERIERWIDGLERIKEMAMMLAGKGKRFKWVIDPLAENCPDCLRLNGRVYTGTVWDRNGVHPKSHRLNCTIGCKCRRELTNEPITRGPFPALIGPKHVHVHYDHDAAKGQGKPGLTVIADLANDEAIAGLFAKLIDGNPEIQWVNPKDLHCTLVSAQLVTDEQAEGIYERLPEAVAPFDIHTTTLERWDKGDYLVWVLRVESPSLVDFQRVVYEAFQAEGIEVSGYSNPDEYTPHVTLAYAVPGVETPTADIQPLDTFVHDIMFTRSDYRPVHVIAEI